MEDLGITIKKVTEHPFFADGVTLAIIILSSIGSFYAGTLYKGEQIKKVSNQSQVATALLAQKEAQTKSVSPSSGFSARPTVSSTDSTQNTTASVSTTGNSQQTKGAFVASKSGTKYYPVGCGSAKRIKPENQVFFATEDAAVAAGYARASTCK